VREVARKYLIDDRLTVATLEPLPLDGRRPAAPGPATGSCDPLKRPHPRPSLPRDEGSQGFFTSDPISSAETIVCHVESGIYCLAAIALLLASGLAVAVPAIQNWRTANGVPVYFIPARELPMVDAQILFNAGSVRDGERPGLAKLTNALAGRRRRRLVGG
jgi:hypothetical protein